MSIALIAGIVRVLFWLAAFVACVYYKRIVCAILFAVITASSSVFMFANAGIPVPDIAFDYAVLVSTPIAAVFCVAVIETARLTGGRGKKWRVW